MSIHLSETMIGDESIGGYFELGLPKSNSENPHKNAVTFQSARAAFRSLLKQKKPTKVWMPKYICDAMIQPLLDESVSVGWYDLDGEFGVEDNLKLGETEWLLYVNYFGVCQPQLDSLLTKYPAKQVVCDFTQAFFDPPRADALATIYSARKFLGVPDGGMLVTDVQIPLPVEQDMDSLQRMTHMLKRLYEEPESGYADYLSSEESLLDTTPKKISGLTKRLLDSIDFNNVKRKRMENFLYLHERLKDVNQFHFDDSKLESPLCYPFITTNESLREHLINNRVFVPTYWCDALARVSDDWATKMIHNLLPIPLDQRYRQKNMMRIIKLVKGK